MPVAVRVFSELFENGTPFFDFGYFVDVFVLQLKKKRFLK
jgi:hypothetical protein